MTAAQVLVLALTTGLAGALVWYFFGPKPAAQQASHTALRLALDLRSVSRGCNIFGSLELVCTC